MFGGPFSWSAVVFAGVCEREEVGSGTGIAFSSSFSLFVVISIDTDGCEKVDSVFGGASWSAVVFMDFGECKQDCS